TPRRGVSSSRAALRQGHRPRAAAEPVQTSAHRRPTRSKNATTREVLLRLSGSWRRRPRLGTKVAKDPGRDGAPTDAARKTLERTMTTNAINDHGPAPTLLDATLGPCEDPRPLAMRGFGLSDRGRVREANEDQFLVGTLTGALRVHQS